MADTISVPKEEYEILREKAMKWDHFIEKEILTEEELKLIEEAEKSNSISEKEAKEKYKKYFAA